MHWICIFLSVQLASPVDNFLHKTQSISKLGNQHWHTTSDKFAYIIQILPIVLLMTIFWFRIQSRHLVLNCHFFVSLPQSEVVPRYFFCVLRPWQIRRCMTPQSFITDDCWCYFDVCLKWYIPNSSTINSLYFPFQLISIFWGSTLKHWNISSFPSYYCLLILVSIGDSCLEQTLLVYLPNSNFLFPLFFLHLLTGNSTVK